MNLADPSADEGKGPLKYAKTNSASRCQALANGNDTNSSDGIKNLILPSSPERGRLPSLPFDPDTMDKNNDEHTGNAFESVSSLPVRRVAEKECSFSERSNSALIQKVQHILDQSQSKEVAQPNDLFFTRNSGSCSSSILNSQSAHEVPKHSKSLTKVTNKLDSSVAQRRQTAQNDSYFDSPAPESANCSRGRPFVEAAEGADEQVKSCNVQLEPLRSPALDAMPYAQWREDASPSCKQPDVGDCNPSTSSRSIMKTNCMNTSSMHGSNAGPNAQDDESCVSPDSSSSLSYITLTEAKDASGCLSSGHEDAEKRGTESSIVKSPCRRYRNLTLAPSFSKPLVNRNEVSQQSVRLTDKLSGASNLNKSRNGLPSITLLDSKKGKAAQVISDDEAVVNISKGTHGSQPLELGISHGSCLVPESHFESPVPKNDVVEFSNDESHVETIKLKVQLILYTTINFTFLSQTVNSSFCFEMICVI